MMRTASNTKHANNDWYEELCALAAIGELSSSEFEELQQHLSECSDCRELCADFRRISADDLGRVAVLKQAAEEDELDDQPDENELLARLLDRAQRERGLGNKPATPQEVGERNAERQTSLRRLGDWLRRPALSYGTVALLVCIGVGTAAYRLKEALLTPTLKDLSAQANRWKNQAEATAAKQRTASELVEQQRSEQEVLRRSLGAEQSKYAELQAQQKMLESQLAGARTQLDQEKQDLEAAKNNADDKNTQIADLQTRLQNAVQRTEEQRRIAENLQSRLEWTQQAVKTTANPPIEQAEANNLFGARDLHIVDVYDVDGNGKTNRTYGRVYYVEKKLLVFYAFDLQDKRHNRTAAGFQAWGYRQPNESKPENLGLFHVDDASMNRWILEVGNPRVLEHVDAVFVTLEPPDGSPSPRGRRLLYANLAGPPNHP
jgi:hypothetical protein